MKKEKEQAQTPAMLEAIGKRFLASYDLDEVFVVADGTVFHDENGAKSYAQNLKENTILKISK